MRLVVDANQAGRVPATLPAGFAGLTLSPFLVAEILLRGPGPRTQTFAVLAAHDLTIGMQPRELLDNIALLQAADIVRATPFPTPNSEVHALSRRLLNRSDYPQAVLWAKKVKASHHKLCRNFASMAARARKSIKEQRIRKLNDFTEVKQVLAQGSESFLGSLVNTTVRKGRPRVVIQNRQALYDAVMMNAYLHRYFHALLYYVVSVSRLWRDQRLNRDPKATRDDWSDLALSLYTGDGDVIVSKDALVRQAFAAIDPTVRVLSAAALGANPETTLRA